MRWEGKIGGELKEAQNGKAYKREAKRTKDHTDMDKIRLSWNVIF